MSDELRAEPETTDPVIGTTLGERYRIEATIARGGCARLSGQGNPVGAGRRHQILSPPSRGSLVSPSASCRGPSGGRRSHIEPRSRCTNRAATARRTHRHGAPRPSPIAARRGRRARAARALTRCSRSGASPCRAGRRPRARARPLRRQVGQRDLGAGPAKLIDFGDRALAGPGARRRHQHRLAPVHVARAAAR